VLDASNWCRVDRLPWIGLHRRPAEREDYRVEHAVVAVVGIADVAERAVGASSVGLTVLEMNWQLSSGLPDLRGGARPAEREDYRVLDAVAVVVVVAEVSPCVAVVVGLVARGGSAGDELAQLSSGSSDPSAAGAGVAGDTEGERATEHLRSGTPSLPSSGSQRSPLRAAAVVGPGCWPPSLTQNWQLSDGDQRPPAVQP
jgi:hypothetical protein